MMKNKVVFCKWGSEKEVAAEIGDSYILSPDNWDDDGYKTLFNVNIYKDGEEYGKFGRKILFENQEEIRSSGGFLEQLLNSKKFLEIQHLHGKYNFISLGYEYDELKKIFPDDFEDILNVLNDVIYLMNKDSENQLLRLKQDDGFQKSLCRDQSVKKFLEEGSSLFYEDTLDARRFQFDFNFKLNKRKYEYSFNFNIEENKLPHRINVLVGKNGSGKSQTLLALSQYFVDNKKEIKNFEITTNNDTSFISNMIVFAYNPHESFPVYKQKMNDYSYLGYRRFK